MSSVRSRSSGELERPASVPSVATGDSTNSVSWAHYTQSLAADKELFRGKWYYEPPGEQYQPIKGRSHRNFLSHNVHATWGLSDMNWWNRVRGEAEFGPSKYASCAGMLTYTESFNKALEHQDSLLSMPRWDPKAKTLKRAPHSMHDLQMVGKLQRGSALIHQRPY